MQMISSSRITLLDSKFRDLKDWIQSHPAGHERGAILFFRKLDRANEEFQRSPRYILIDSFKLSDDWLISSSPTHIEMRLTKLVDAYFRCENENLCLGFIHSHPIGFSSFSKQDDIHEKNILKGLLSCNGDQTNFVSMIICGDYIKARVYQNQEYIYARHVTELGEGLKIHLNEPHEIKMEHLKRQEAAFGAPFNLKMNSLRAAVIGVGGTGSPLATLLARCGIGELVVIDGDKLEKTNMNRVRGYNKNDIGNYKAKALSDYIDSFGLDANITYITSQLEESPEAIDMLSSCDVVFGCTDDNIGRSILLESAYYYGFIYIDIGLTGFIGEDSQGEPILRDHRGRISTILPESGACLYCQRVINQNKIEFEEAVKKNPELKKLSKEQLEKDFYLRGGGIQAPGVGPFTSATADLGVATFMNLIKPYRSLAEDLRQDNIWIDFVNMYFHSNTPERNEDCSFCETRSFLLKDENGYRLGMPRFGKLK